MKKKKKKKNIQKTKNKIHPSITEEFFIETIDKITQKLAYKFKFAYHTHEDIKQQATIFALEAMSAYDDSRPLENFLWTHIRNRLYNYKRDNYQRPDKPCLKCEHYDKDRKVSTSQCSLYCNKENCELYQIWSNRNNTKKNLVAPQFIDDKDYIFEHHTNTENTVANKEIISKIENELSVSDRETYLKLKHGNKVPKAELDKLKNSIEKILNTHDYK
jgi:hypothetical protein